jgi:hypothetical protein
LGLQVVRQQARDIRFVVEDGNVNDWSQRSDAAAGAADAGEWTEPSDYQH